LFCYCTFACIGDEPLAVMLTGDTGAGKSSACNFFFGRKVFEVGPRMSSVTPKSNSAEMEVNGRKLQLVDTPGFAITLTMMKKELMN